jgi:hypothetical protein
MTSQTRVQRRCAYSTYRELFTGKNACVRKSRAIRSIILRHSAVSKTTTGDCPLDKIVPILKSLLNDRVFESEEQAKRLFPELFPKLPKVRRASKFSMKRSASPERSRDIEGKGRDDNLNNLGQSISKGMFLASLCSKTRDLTGLACRSFHR